jgi:hypothetical protein
MSALEILTDLVKFRISNNIPTDIEKALELSLSAFNMVPQVTYFEFGDDDENIIQLKDILVTYAAYVLLTQKACDLAEKNIRVEDNGISFQPIGPENTIYLARELWNNWQCQVQDLKQSESFISDFVEE